MSVTVYKTIRRHGKVWVLIDAADLKQHVQHNQRAAVQAGFKPPTYEVEPYLTKKHTGPSSLIWVVWS